MREAGVHVKTICVRGISESECVCRISHFCRSQVRSPPPDRYRRLRTVRCVVETNAFIRKEHAGMGSYPVPPGNLESLIKRINALLRCAHFRNHIGAAGCAKGEADFDTWK